MGGQVISRKVRFRGTGNSNKHGLLRHNENTVAGDLSVWCTVFRMNSQIETESTRPNLIRPKAPRGAVAWVQWAIGGTELLRN